MMYGALFISGLVACVMVIVLIGHEAEKADHGAPQSAMYGHQN
jgi:hypothetical protein